MKSKYLYRKKFKEIADSMGFFDTPLLVWKADPVTKKESPLLINNHKRFVDGMLKLSLSEQKKKLQKFEELQRDLETGVATGTIEFNKLLKEAQTVEQDQSSEEVNSDSEINLGSDS